jgi:murein DD-endopeptidase MepM/ murein hydrolase activator NlpD
MRIRRLPGLFVGVACFAVSLFAVIDSLGKVPDKPERPRLLSALISADTAEGAAQPVLATSLVPQAAPSLDFDSWQVEEGDTGDPSSDRAAGESEASETVAEVEPAAGPIAYDYVYRTKRGDTLGAVLAEIGVTSEDVSALLEKLRRHVDPRRIRTGAELTFNLQPIDDGTAHRLLGFGLETRREGRIALHRSPDGEFAAEVDAAGTTEAEAAKTTETAGTVAHASATIHSSLFATAKRAGIPHSIIAEVVTMFSWDVDFERDIQPGDHIDVLYERTAGGRGKPGHVVAAMLTLRGKPQTLYRYEPREGGVDFLDESGRSARKDLLRTPIDGARLSSRFGYRRHPILGYSRMHRGIDFAAGTGTPIVAAGDGRIVEIGRQSGYGKYVRIDHRSGYSTTYAHMSRFGRGLKQGSSVQQGQVIGYVGSTGLTTGPHLHYEVIRDGNHIDPATVRRLPGRELRGRERQRFLTETAALRTRLADTTKQNGTVLTVAAGPEARSERLEGLPPPTPNPRSRRL